MKILIIFTGGTIGSSISDGTISPDNSMKYCLLNNYYVAKNPEDIEFFSIEPYTILSENITAKHINVLIKCVGENLKKDYDGIIVTHGTDTLQFSASALSYAFRDAKKPVLLVSSNLPLSEEGANGNLNFEAAVEFVRGKAGEGIFISYANRGENVRFHRADNVLTHAETCDDVRSLNDNYYAEYIDGAVRENPNYLPSKERKGLGEFELNQRSQVLVINSFPGMLYEYDVKMYKAVIFRPYHSGTLNTSDERFIAFCERAKKANIPAFVINVPSGNVYESSLKYEKMGITPLPNSTFTDVFVKAWIAVSAGYDVKKFVVGE